ncbi:hypothetical protein BZA05DRAFT_396939 [Tricharina praecox]|uniref:uncharacterized protein n=1 Tax=Tricharina praecox TaxID=43433 RepID=UPI002220E9CA|nr:uncharacterized protein BZA05DRAFT_396939 [Tricharina praecox]KAI5852135.1 hypothetical protein BZA05DRAFT_396939 [Tricharina praecox]
MPPTTPYPRSVVKRIAKAHTGFNVGKNVDIQLYLQYKLFMQELLREADLKARKRGATRISPTDIKKVTSDVLQKFKV